jgi:hypothetical protein
MTPSSLIEQANKYPFDAPDKWWQAGVNDPNPPPPAQHWSVSAARAIVKSLQEQKGIAQELAIDKIDEKTREAIILSISEVVKFAASNTNMVASSDNHARMAELMYGESIEKVLSNLRNSILGELGKLLSLQAKGAVVPPDIVVKEVKFPLVAKV